MINKYLTEMHLHTKETSNCGKMPSGNGEILAGNSNLRIVICGSTRYGCGDILQKLSEKYFCPGTSAHTDGDPFSWTEKENKKNDYSCFTDLRVDTERMCGN